MVTQQQMGSCLFQPMLCDTCKFLQALMARVLKDGYQIYEYNNVNRIARVPTLFVLPFIFFLSSFNHFNILLQHQNDSLMKLLSSVWIKKVLGQKAPRFRVSHILQSPLNQPLGNLSLLFLVLISSTFLHFSTLRFAFPQLSKSFIPFLYPTTWSNCAAQAGPPWACCPETGTCMDSFGIYPRTRTPQPFWAITAVPSHPYSKNMFLDVQREPLGFQFLLDV